MHVLHLENFYMGSKMDKNCEGCSSYATRPIKPFCKSGMNDKEGICPCGNCLIKSMCDVACTDFKNFLYGYKRNG